MSRFFSKIAVLLTALCTLIYSDSSYANSSSFEELQAGCIAGNQPACVDVGIMMTDGLLVEKDERRGA